MESGALLFGTLKITSALHPKQTPTVRAVELGNTGRDVLQFIAGRNSAELKVATIQMLNFSLGVTRMEKTGKKSLRGTAAHVWMLDGDEARDGLDVSRGETVNPSVEGR